MAKPRPTLWIEDRMTDLDFYQTDDFLVSVFRSEMTPIQYVSADTIRDLLKVYPDVSGHAEIVERLKLMTEEPKK